MNALSRLPEATHLLSSGPDGFAYAASFDGKPAVLHRLKVSPERLQQLEARLRQLALAEDSHLSRLLAVQLDGAEPWLVLPREEEASYAGAPVPPRHAAQLAQSLAESLAAAHRVGLVHGALKPSALGLLGGRPLVDVSGVATGSHLPSDWDGGFSCPDAWVTASADCWALGKWLELLLGDADGSGPDAALISGLKLLLRELIDSEPSFRPTAFAVANTLRRLLTPTGGVESPTLPARVAGAGESPERLGRFKLEQQLGRGATGRVFKAVDLADGRVVALKVLDAVSGESAAEVRARFRKESRLLAQVHSPYIANLIEANHDGDDEFMAVELIDGQDLHQRLKRGQTFTEAEVLQIGADLCRALVEVHARGIVHRDIKPSNVMSVGPAGGPLSVKLVDFGIARHFDPQRSEQLTQAGVTIGTPAFMSPEQCEGKPLGGASDIYSLGVTLYALVAGKSPFDADHSQAIFQKHFFEVPARLDEVNEQISPELGALLARCLDKEPARRPTAADLVRELTQLQQETPSPPRAHPARPLGARALTYRFEWDLKPGRRELWWYVANTDRLNRALGNGAVSESFRTVEGELQRLGTSGSGFSQMKWHERPFEWVQYKRLGVLREMFEGPLRWFRTEIDLEPLAGGGTHVTHVVELEPTGPLTRVLANLQIGLQLRPALNRVYRRLDELISRPGGVRLIDDPFEAPDSLLPDVDAKLSAIERRMVAAGAPRDATERLGEFLRLAPAKDVSYLRPLELAPKLSVEPGPLVEACLHAAKEGALELAWDLLCPRCRVPSQLAQSLQAVKSHGHCEACSLEYELDLASSVELVFRAHPSLRATDRRTYCLGSPAHRPHLAAQVRVDPDEVLELQLELDDGAYRLTGGGDGYPLEFRVLPSGAARWDVPLSKAPGPELRRALRRGTQTLALRNDTGKERLVRIERAAARTDALTAAQMTVSPLFRKLFPGELFDPRERLKVSQVALLMVEAAPAALSEGELEARHALLLRVEERVHVHGGRVVRLAGDGVVAVFSEVTTAVRAGFALAGDAVALRVAVHRGAAAVVALGGQLDYFGQVVLETQRLLSRAKAGELVLSEAAAAAPGVLELGVTHRRRGQLDLEADVPCLRWPLSASLAEGASSA